MAKQAAKNLDYYITTDSFSKGNKVLLSAYDKLRGQEQVLAGEKFIDAMRLHLITDGLSKVLPLTKQYGREVAKINSFNKLMM